MKFDTQKQTFINTKLLTQDTTAPKNVHNCIGFLRSHYAMIKFKTISPYFLWLKDITDDGDVESNPGPHQVIATSQGLKIFLWNVQSLAKGFESIISTLVKQADIDVVVLTETKRVPDPIKSKLIHSLQYDTKVPWDAYWNLQNPRHDQDVASCTNGVAVLFKEQVGIAEKMSISDNWTGQTLWIKFYLDKARWKMHSWDGLHHNSQITINLFAVYWRDPNSSAQEAQIIQDEKT